MYVLRKPQTYLRIHMLADVFDIFCVNSQRQQGGHVETNLHVDSAEKVRVTKAELEGYAMASPTEKQREGMSEDPS